MEFFNYFGVGAMVGGMISWIYAQWRHNQALQDECRRMEEEICELEELVYGFTEFNQSVQEKKESRKQKILLWLQEGVELQSSEVAKRLNISTRTVRNYLTELVEEGLVTQSAAVGRDVSYQIAVESNGAQITKNDKNGFK